MIYLLVFILLLMPVIKYDWMAKTGGENKWYYFNLVVLVLLAGLRYRVGGDTFFYMVMFEDCPKLEELKYFDFETAAYNPLWYILNAISRSIYDSFTFFQIIHALIINSIFFWFFRKYCPLYYFTAILLYYIAVYFYFNMEVLRESLAISILLLSIPFLIKKRWILYFLMCVIALQFHYSALVMFLFPFLFIFFKKTTWKQQIFIFLSILILTSVVNVPMLLLSLLSIDEQVMSLAENYLSYERNIMGMLACIIKYLPLLGMIYLRERYNVKTSFNLSPFVFGVVVVYAFSINLVGVDRLLNYFAPFVLLYAVDTIYYIISNIKLKFTLGYSVFFASFFLLAFNYYYYYARDYSDVYPNTKFYSIFYPYHSVFSKKQDKHRERFIENFRDTVINI